MDYRETPPSPHLAGLIKSRWTLAGHAADRGFADQAHMAREFRRLAGVPATAARRRSGVTAA